MGRRSINTTKGGKYMNPTDQARKEARKKELKKNKKQRLMVRQAVLKGKDPAQLLEEMEKIDEMEFNVYQPSPLNEKVLKEKRKKLKETFDRVMRLYHADNPEVWGDLKRKELDYELRRAKKEQYFESVKHAQSVVVDEIPLPQLPTEGTAATTAPGHPPPGAPHRAPPVLLTNVPIPSFLQQQQHNQGILKKPSEKTALDKETSEKKDPPGCPPGPPPILALFRDLDDDYVDEPVVKRSKIRFSDETIAKDDLLAVEKEKRSAGKNIDDLMREVEHDQRRREVGRGLRSGSGDEDSNKSHGETDSEAASSGSDDEGESEEEAERNRRRRGRHSEEDDDDDEEGHDEEEENSNRLLPLRATSNIPPVNPAPPPAMHLPPQISLPQKPPMIVPPPPPMSLPPGNMLYHPPPPMRPGGLPGMPMRMPGNRPGLPPGPPPMGMRMPPGPPPPRMKHHHSGGGPGGHHSHHNSYNHHSQQQQQQHQHSSMNNKDPKSATITAKPQIRNLSADVTRFVPSTLRTKKEEKGPPKPMHMSSMAHKMNRPPPGSGGPGSGGAGVDSNKGKTKDDAYIQFMREMQGLL